jgi:adenosylcobinamide-phosphate synthase
VSEMLTSRAAILICAFLLDALVGDPHWLWHPVQGIGWLISALEKTLRKAFSVRDGREEDIGKKRAAGVILAVLVPLITLAVTGAILAAAALVPVLSFVVQVILCCQCLAARSLADAARDVYKPLKEGDLAGARKAVSMVVGRDTQVLDAAGVVRAAVETVAENASDGVIAPLFWMAIAGPLGGFFYKSVNTMDSMIGYKNDRYRYFGTAAAKLDDIVNFIPSRLAGLLITAAAFLLKQDGRNAWKIFRRDRSLPASPNAGQTESAAAGALDIQLGGDAQYFGRMVHKPALGEAIREIRPDDILTMNRLMYAAAVMALVLFSALLAAFTI